MCLTCQLNSVEGNWLFPRRVFVQSNVPLPLAVSLLLDLCLPDPSHPPGPRGAPSFGEASLSPLTPHLSPPRLQPDPTLCLWSRSPPSADLPTRPPPHSQGLDRGLAGRVGGKAGDLCHPHVHGHGDSLGGRGVAPTTSPKSPRNPCTRPRRASGREKESSGSPAGMSSCLLGRGWAHPPRPG